MEKNRNVLHVSINYTIKNRNVLRLCIMYMILLQLVTPILHEEPGIT